MILLYRDGGVNYWLNDTFVDCGKSARESNSESSHNKEPLNPEEMAEYFKQLEIEDRCKEQEEKKEKRRDHKRNRSSNKKKDHTRLDLSKVEYRSNRFHNFRERERETRQITHIYYHPD